jgi:protein SCO1/2
VRSARHGRRLLAAALAAALLALTGCGGSTAGDGPVSGYSQSADDGLNGIVLPRAYRVPHVSLTDTHGDAYDLRAHLRDRDLTLVFFGYSNCPDVCGLVMANIASALTRLDAADRDRVGMVFVTTDPARDDVATTRDYVTRFDPSFEGLTGPLPRILDLGKALGVDIEKGQKLPSGGYEVTHGTQVLGMLPDGSAPVLWTAATSPAAIAQDLTTILDDGVPTPPEAAGSSNS